MSKHTELTKFWANGKTFFFNRGEAKTGAPYLAINALYGQGRQERLVLFEPHWAGFRRTLDEALGKLGLQSLVDEPGASSQALGYNCPSCGIGATHFRLDVFIDRKSWEIYCTNCRTPILASQES